MLIRKARSGDAEQACEVMRRSIIELCEADHGSDPAILEKWLANKTPANVRTWIAAPDAHMFVAVDGEEMLGVAAVRSSGEITLNYVSPGARFRGVSKALLAALEAKARELGHERCVLTSTATAHRFYLAAGYQEEPGLPISGFSTSASRRMAKVFSLPRRVS
jgi:GNAT superfamily N-acetyltransferase